jgi:hypothetical protein
MGGAGPTAAGAAGRSRPGPAGTLQRAVDLDRLGHAWGWQNWLGYGQLRPSRRSFREDRIRDLLALKQPVEESVDCE